ncbi:hypothetical protein TSAR_006492 [Trichomalopsis sarcophagae]|uniref:Secreted protein n=1 Tax=Trichomalopsis sarcophagae TaxID=543379 RepID=A0A232EFG7_9HYME|nr:hypothetical protein TSAR_006492 [Trichomalopsis sarcophagae]
MKRNEPRLSVFLHLLSFSLSLSTDDPYSPVQTFRPRHPSRVNIIQCTIPKIRFGKLGHGHSVIYCVPRNKSSVGLSLTSLYPALGQRLIVRSITVIINGGDSSPPMDLW